MATKALGELQVEKALAKLTERLKKLPLDANENEEFLLFEAISKIDNSDVIELAKSRLVASLQTGQNMKREVLVIGIQETDESAEFVLALLDDPRAVQIQASVINILGKRNPTWCRRKTGFNLTEQRSVYGIRQERTLANWNQVGCH